MTLAEWMEDRKLSLYVLLAITAGALYITYVILRPFLTALVLALVMAVALFPAYNWFIRYFRNSYLASFCTTALALALVVVPFILFGARIAAQATDTYSSVLQALRDPTLWPLRFDALLDKVAEITGTPTTKLKADLTVVARQLASWMLGIATSLGRHLGQQMWTMALAFIFLPHLLRNSSEFRRGATSILPLSRRQSRDLSLTIYRGIVADIYGVVAVGVAEGMLLALGFWICGLPSPLFWGTVAIVLSCIPFLGVSIVWIPACLILVLHDRWTTAAFLLAWCGIVVATAEGMVRSAVVSGRTRVNSMLIMLSIMGGLVAFGAVGIFIGPVVLVLVNRLVCILREEHASLQESRFRPAA